MLVVSATALPIWRIVLQRLYINILFVYLHCHLLLEKAIINIGKSNKSGASCIVHLKNLFEFGFALRRALT